MKKNRMTIVISFLDKDDYEYAKNMPNSSHYIRELVANDRKQRTQENHYIDKKIKEIQDYLDKKLKNVIKNGENLEINRKELKNKAKAIMNNFD